MPRNDPYKEYRYESEKFLLRQVRPEDAPDLWECYSDPAAVALMNDDNCQNGFLCPGLEDMQEYIRYWNEEYEKRYYIRPAMIHKGTGKAIGTMEAFGGELGVLRLDLNADWERPEVLAELLGLAVREFPQDLAMGGMVIKAVPEAGARRAALEALGFSGPQRFRDYEDYFRLDLTKIRSDCGK